MAEKIICEACDCGCKILPYKCLYEKQARLKKLHIEEYPEILNAVNSFILIGDTEHEAILGQRCFDALCNDIKQAEQQAQQYREDNIGDKSEKTEHWYYLSDIWRRVLQNSHFKNMYSAYAMYYYYALGIAVSETSRDGDVKHKRAGVDNSGEASENISLEESKSKQSASLGIARRYAALFKNNFLEKNRKSLPCLRDDCDAISEHFESEHNHHHKRKPKRPRSTAI